MEGEMGGSLDRTAGGEEGRREGRGESCPCVPGCLSRTTGFSSDTVAASAIPRRLADAGCKLRPRAELRHPTAGPGPARRWRLGRARPST